MTIMLVWTALRCRPLSSLWTLVLAIVWLALLRLPVAAGLVVWLSLGLLAVTGWRLVEPYAVRRLGGRRPGRLELSRLEPAQHQTGADVWVVDGGVPWLAPALGAVVVGRDLLDLVEERGLIGLLAQAVAQQRSAGLVGELLVWLGNLPLLGAWFVNRGLSKLGWLLAVELGAALCVPLLLWPVGFPRWLGRAFGLLSIGLLGSALVVAGSPGVGLALLLGWIAVPGLRALLAWETRRLEARADQATLEAGLGWPLLEGLEALAWAEAPLRPRGPLGILVRPGAPIARRIERIQAHLSGS